LNEQDIKEIRVDVENDEIEVKGAFDRSEVIFRLEEAGYLVYSD
jgi:hypothetical protein